MTIKCFRDIFKFISLFFKIYKFTSHLPIPNILLCISENFVANNETTLVLFIWSIMFWIVWHAKGCRALFLACISSCQVAFDMHLVGKRVMVNFLKFDLVLFSWFQKGFFSLIIEVHDYFIFQRMELQFL